MVNKQGSPNFRQIRNKDTTAANSKRSAQADAFAMHIGQVLNDLGTQGYGSHRLAQLLNDEGHRTSRGKEWNATAVKRLLERLSRIGRSGRRSR